jgi:hypothetical protein
MLPRIPPTEPRAEEMLDVDPRCSSGIESGRSEEKAGPEMEYPMQVVVKHAHKIQKLGEKTIPTIEVAYKRVPVMIYGFRFPCC